MEESGVILLPAYKKMWIYLQIRVAVLGVLATTSFCYSIWIVLLLLKLPLKKVVQQIQYFVLAVWWCFYKMTYQQSQVTAETRTLEMQVVWDLDIC